MLCERSELIRTDGTPSSDSGSVCFQERLALRLENGNVIARDTNTSVDRMVPRWGFRIIAGPEGPYGERAVERTGWQLVGNYTGSPAVLPHIRAAGPPS